MRILAGALAALLGSTAAQAAVVDNFDRPDATTLGPNYTVQNGSFRIQNNQAITTSFAALATYNGSSASAAGIDVSLRGADAGSYVALSFGFDTAQSYFVKVQDNNGDGFFDRYAFYGGNNDFNGIIADLNPFQTGSIDVSYSGTTATLNVLANGITQTFSYNYGYAPGSGLVGFGLNRLGVADNLRFDGGPVAGVPEPATWALMIGGFGLAGAAARRRRRPAVALA